MAQPGYFTKHPAAAQRAVMLRRQGLTHTEISDRLRQETGTYISPDGVRQHLARVGIPTELGAFDSTGLSRGRYALLVELSRLGRKADVDDLARAGTGPRRAVTLLHSLRKQGLVSFVETSSEMGHGHHRGISRIEITDVGRAALLRTGTPVAIDVARGDSVVDQTVNDIMAEKRVHDVVALADAIDDVADALEAAVAAAAAHDDDDTGAVAQDQDHPRDDDMPQVDRTDAPWLEPAASDDSRNPWLGPLTPETQAALDSWADARAGQTWPVLAGLRQRVARQRRLAALLREAAELADDEALGVSLLEQADTIPGLSDIELEYMRFADAHAGATQTPDAAGGGA